MYWCEKIPWHAVEQVTSLLFVPRCILLSLSLSSSLLILIHYLLIRDIYRILDYNKNESSKIHSFGMSCHVLKLPPNGWVQDLYSSVMQRMCQQQMFQQIRICQSTDLSCCSWHEWNLTWCCDIQGSIYLDCVHHNSRELTVVYC